MTQRLVRLGACAVTLSLLSLGAAQVKLPDPSCPSDVRCKNPDTSASLGTVGKGAPFATGGFTDRVGSGFIDTKENALYVPFEAGGQLDAYGSVMRVDLRTGDRTLVSGANDELDSRGKGVQYTSDRGNRVTGWNLGNIYAVRPGPDGTLYALVDKLGQERTEIFRIDKKTGDRTIVWASKLADDATSSSVKESIQNVEARLGIIPANLCDRVKPFISFEVDPRNGDLLLVSKVGLARVKPGGSCNWVSRWDDQDLGSGVKPVTNVVTSTTLYGRELSFVSGPGNTGLYGVNIDTGERRVISLLNTQVPARSIGKGEVYLGFLGGVARNDEFWLSTGYTSQRGFAATASELNGDRGIIEPVGSLGSGQENNMGIVAAVPGTQLFIAWYQKALHVLDPNSGESYLLSK